MLLSSKQKTTRDKFYLWNWPKLSMRIEGSGGECQAGTVDFYSSNEWEKQVSAGQRDLRVGSCFAPETGAMGMHMPRKVLDDGIEKEVQELLDEAEPPPGLVGWHRRQEGMLEVPHGAPSFSYATGPASLEEVLSESPEESERVWTEVASGQRLRGDPSEPDRNQDESKLRRQAVVLKREPGILRRQIQGRHDKCMKMWGTLVMRPPGLSNGNMAGASPFDEKMHGDWITAVVM
ncbi:hypothetical protein GOP47_0015364 [Adiantum capillus-veneris]|uniref:Uncharacterized protein n=1 Tax=Adiantum capillus-veneris TaxID=13818 RepID=A0A9D4UKI3_ADICA|nr:hypothetical protein GOP47_0015364 [Adiantum capillus-veneris]